MALRPLQAQNPYGTFDGLDTDNSSLLGGEVVSFTTLNAVSSPDLSAHDIKDGYSGTTVKLRPAVTYHLVSGVRPLFLADEGQLYYGTLFGTLVGGTAGQSVPAPGAGTQLGPHTTAGSGKVTLWNFPGLYGVTLDAVDTTASTGLVPDNASLVTGAPLNATSSGKLTPQVGSAFEATVVARFVEFETLGSLVTTPNTLVSAVNSPTGSLNGAQKVKFDHVKIFFSLEP